MKTIKLIIGFSLLAGFFALLAFSTPPTGVIAHSVENDIDATPIFYGDVENMSELEEGVKELIGISVDD